MTPLHICSSGQTGIHDGSAIMYSRVVKRRGVRYGPNVL